MARRKASKETPRTATANSLSSNNGSLDGANLNALSITVRGNVAHNGETARVAESAQSASAASTVANGNGHDQPATLQTPQLSEKMKELVRLAQEQGYLTYNDINDALPHSVTTAEELEEVIIELRNLEVEIVDQAEVDRVKQPQEEEQDEKSRLDILDDPVRMY